MHKEVSKYMAELARKSWAKRNSPEEIARLRSIGKLGGRPKKTASKTS